MKIKTLPYGTQWLDDDDIEGVLEVLRSDYLSQGPKLREFEEQVANYTGAKYCVCVSSGTAALHLAVKVLNVEKGMEGLTSPLTFIASSNSFIYNQIKPDFADINERTYCIAPEEVEKKMGQNRNTRVIIPIHFAGHPADMEEINEIVKTKQVAIIEDASHAIGSYLEDGSAVGSCKYSHMTVFSFQPVKTITTGEGGAITTNNKDFYERLLLLRNHGITKDNQKFVNKGPKLVAPWYYEMQDLGLNYRMTEIQAALGISQLKKLNRFIKRRREIVKAYNNAFKNIEWLTIPYEKNGVFSAFHLYVLKIDFGKIGKSRGQVMQELRAKGIGTQVHYLPVHLQPYYKNIFGFKEGDFPTAEEYYKHCLSIPLYPKMTDDDIYRVITEIKGLSD